MPAFSMTNAYAIAAIWLGLAVAATVLANHIRISTALVEICVGIAAGTVATRYFGADSLGGNLDWLRFLAGTGAVVLTFLAGAELEPAVLRAKWKEVSVVGAVGFAAPFLGCAALARYAARLGRAGELAGGRGALDDLHGRRVRRHARDGLQQDGLRQGNPRGLLHQRPRDGDCAGADLRAVHVQDGDLRRDAAPSSWPRCRS